MSYEENRGPLGPIVVSGRGGSSSKGSSGSGASATPDTLFSTSVIRLVGLIGEGPIGGVVNGLKGVYRNKVPVQNPDGTFNYKGITAEFRQGDADQAYMEGYPDVETEIQVGTVVTKVTPVVAALADPDYDRVRVLLFVPALGLGKVSDGTKRANVVAYRIELRYYNGPWISQGDFEINGKTEAGYYRQHEFALPMNPAGAASPWQVRVSRLTEDDDKANLAQTKFVAQSTFQLYSVTGIVDSKLTYPHSAVVGITAQTSQLGDSLGDFTLLVDGIEMPVPSNRDKATRTYSGVWDGTFKLEVCDNPVWLLYLLLQDDTFGLGEYIDTSVIDKWSFYEIGRYCDVAVSDGAGGFEPRFTFNGQITEAQEAYELLQLVSQAFRGMTYWGSGSVTASQDSPTDYTILATEANVLADGFKYSSSARKARHTVAIVAWHDPSDFYAENLEYVVDGPGIALYGYNATKIDLLGCTSRGQAHRAGLWTLLTELYETQIVSYRAGLDHAHVRPGDVVAVQDPQISGLDISGRLRGTSTTRELVLDRSPNLIDGVEHQVSVILPDGSVEIKAILRERKNASGHHVLDLADDLSARPVRGAVWQITGSVVPQKFRVVSVHEVEANIYEITGLQYEPTKFAAVDDGAPLVPDNISLLPNKVEPPTNLTASTSNYLDLGQPKQLITFSWLPGSLFNSVAYYVSIVRPSGDVVNLPRTASTSIDLLDASAGDYTFVVVAVGVNGTFSLPATLKYTMVGWEDIPGPEIINLQVVGGGTTFTGPSCAIEWDIEWPPGVTRYAVDFVVRAFEVGTNQLLSGAVTAGAEFTYTFDQNLTDGGPRRQFWLQVRPRDIIGREGKPASIRVSNPAPDKIFPTFQTTSENIFMSYARPTDPDFVGTLTWYSETSGFDPRRLPPNVDVIGSPVVIPGVINRTYYIVTAGYDRFGRVDLNYSDEYEVRVTNMLFDPSDPGIPQGLTLETEAEVAPDGTASALVRATWDAIDTENLGYYEVSFSIGEGLTDDAFVGGETLSGTSWVRHGITPGTRVNVRVRSISKNTFGRSGFSEIASIVAALNNEPPGDPTNFEVNSATLSAFLSWSNPTNRDLAGTQVYAGPTTNLSDARLLDLTPSPGKTYRDGTLPVSDPRFYWIRSLNTSGVLGRTFVGPVRGVSAGITGAAIAAGTIEASAFATTIRPVEVLDELPTSGNMDGRQVYLKTDNLLYRYDGRARKFTAALPAGQIEGELSADQLGEGSVTAAKLAENAVTLKALAEGAVTTRALTEGAVTAATLASEAVTSAALKANAVTATKISSDAIETRHILANAIDAGKIAAGSINTGHLTAGSVTTATIAANAITTGLLAANAVTAVNIAALSISTGHLTAGAVTADTIAANAIRTRHILSEAITTDLLAANAITTNKIAANSITAGLIQAGAVGADQVAARAISTSKLAVQTSNKAFNGDVTQGTLGYYVAGNSSPHAVSPLTVIRDAWCPSGMQALVVNVPGGMLSGQVVDIGHRRVAPDGSLVEFGALGGTTYEFSCGMSNHRCWAQLYIDFSDANGTSIVPILSPIYAETPASGGPVSTFNRIGVIAKAPLGATSARLRYRMHGIFGSDQYLFISAVTFMAVPEGTTEFQPYTDPSVTAIDGGTVVTNTLHATKITARTITADRIQAATLTATEIAADTITTRELRSDVLVTSNILVNGTGSNLFSVINGSDSVKISGGAISANSIEANRLRIGSRNIKTVGIEFYTERDSNGNLNGIIGWTRGNVLYTTDTGVGTNQVINAGRFQIDGGNWYVYWAVGDANFGLGKDNSDAVLADPRLVLMASYNGFTSLAVFFGGTVVDGTKITALSIQADKIAANQIQAQHIAAGAVTADKITSGQIVVGSAIRIGNYMVIEAGADRPRFYTRDTFGTLRTCIGYVGDLYSAPGGYTDRADYGIVIWDGYGRVLVGPTGIDGGGIFVNSITADKIRANSITTGQLTTDRLIVNGHLYDNAATTPIAASGSGQSAGLSITLRNAGGAFLIQVFRRGGGAGRYNEGVDPGVLQIYVTSNLQNRFLLDALIADRGYYYDAGLRANYTLLGMGGFSKLYRPGYAGNFYIEVVDTNTGGVGGVEITVTEQSK